MQSPALDIGLRIIPYAAAASEHDGYRLQFDSWPRESRRRLSIPILLTPRSRRVSTDESTSMANHDRHDGLFTSHKRQQCSSLRTCDVSGSSRCSHPLYPYSHRPCLDMRSLVTTMACLVLATLLLRPAAAVMLPFDNCLPTSLISEPTSLQWVPRFVDAVFEEVDSSHNLRVTMWGNVTGGYRNESVPSSTNVSYWDDPLQTAGKIVAIPFPEADDPKITTLHTGVKVMTYDPWSDDTDFCNASLVNATCPLGPVFNASVALPSDLPSVSVNRDLNSSYAFTAFSATLMIFYGDADSTVIGCASTTITPDLGNLAWMLKFLPLMVLLAVGFATVFAGICSPWGTTDVFNWTSNYGRDADLLRLVTPGFGDCLQYIQFIALTGALTLNYPGFYQPIVSQASWSALMFNESFVSKEPGWVSVQDGLYFTNGTCGLEKLAQLVGMGRVDNIWVGMMVWLLVIIGAMAVLVEGGFLAQWIHRLVRRIPEEDFRRKNIPFLLGNVARIVLNYFLLPIVALSLFQPVVTSVSRPYTVTLAAVTIVLILGFAIWLLRLIGTTKPRAFLFDDLPTVLLYGPLYNTYSDDAATFALIPFFCTFLRGVAIGAVQSSGVAQIVLLAICEVVQILTVYAFRPFSASTSMNAYHTFFSAFRLITVLLMIPFTPSLGVTEGPKGWIGYAILVSHATVLLLGFFLNALQTIIEVVARLFGAGVDDVRGQTRGGLSKIFGMRQLSRRISRRDLGPSRQSQMSTSGMLVSDETAKAGLVMSSGRLRSESAGSAGMVAGHRQRSSSPLDNLSLEAPLRHDDTGHCSFTPTTPGKASVFSFLPSSSARSRHAPDAPGHSPADPYYRPPRTVHRGPTLDDAPSPRERAHWTSADLSHHRHSSHGGEPCSEAPEMDRPTSAGVMGAFYTPSKIPFAPRADYSTREVDFYYGVRGSKLNSDGPSRKLGTGPADPTGPMASAAGWFRNMIGGKSKDKGKGFEVVRSARMPPAMRAAGADFGDNAPPEGIPVAMGVLRNGPIESDDEDERLRAKKKARARDTGLLAPDGTPRDDESEDGEGTRLDNVPQSWTEVDTAKSVNMPSRA